MLQIFDYEVHRSGKDSKCFIVHWNTVDKIGSEVGLSTYTEAIFVPISIFLDEGDYFWRLETLYIITDARA